MIVFRDSSGQPCGFKWWLKFNIAFLCLKYWLRYEGMPKNLKKPKEVFEWEEKQILAQMERNKNL